LKHRSIVFRDATALYIDGHGVRSKRPSVDRIIEIVESGLWRRQTLCQNPCGVCLKNVGLRIKKHEMSFVYVMKRTKTRQRHRQLRHGRR
jgi:hypothetical protein